MFRAHKILLRMCFFARFCVGVPPPPTLLAIVEQLAPTPSAHKRSTAEAPSHSPFSTPTKEPAQKRVYTHAPIEFPQLGDAQNVYAPMSSPAAGPADAPTARIFAKECIHTSEWAFLEQNEHKNVYERAVHHISMQLKATDESQWSQVVATQGPRILLRECKAAKMEMGGGEATWPWGLQGSGESYA